MKILIADDEFGLRKLLEYTLDGFELHFASDGKEAIKKAKEIHPEIIILDIMMPKFDGFDVVREIRIDASTRDTYVIMLSAKHEKSDIQKAVTAGADEYITKPFEPENLKKRIETIIRQLKSKEPIIESFNDYNGSLHYVRGRL